MNLQSVIESGANVAVMVSVTDLKEFALQLMHDAAQAGEQKERERKETEYLPINEVAQKLNVCKATLWRWEKEGILTPRRVGRKLLYKLTDVQLLMEN